MQGHEKGRHTTLTKKGLILLALNDRWRFTLSFPFFRSSLFAILHFDRNEKADSTLRSSQAVPHPSTDRALRCLTSEVKRDPVHSARYGRRRHHCGLSLSDARFGHRFVLGVCFAFCAFKFFGSLFCSRWQFCFLVQRGLWVESSVPLCARSCTNAILDKSKKKN